MEEELEEMQSTSNFLKKDQSCSFCSFDRSSNDGGGVGRDAVDESFRLFRPSKSQIPSLSGLRDSSRRRNADYHHPTTQIYRGNEKHDG